MESFHPRLGKIGFVLTGGSFQGAFEVGALKAFNQHHITPAYIVGVSAGALNAAAFAAGQLELLIKTYLDVAKKPTLIYKWDFFNLLRAFFWSKSLLVNTPLEQIIKQRFSLQGVIASAIKVDIVTTDFQTGEKLVFSNKNPEQQTSQILAKALLASSAMPIIFSPVPYRGHQLFDGSVAEIAPVGLAIREGCDTIFAVLTNSRHSIEINKELSNIFDIAKRTASIITWQNLNSDLKRCFEINNDVLSYKQLANEIFELLGEEIKDETKRQLLQAALAKIFEDKNFSFQDKKTVNLILIEPEEGISSKIFDHKNIPYYLEAGYQKTNRILAGLNLIS